MRGTGLGDRDVGNPGDGDFAVPNGVFAGDSGIMPIPCGQPEGASIPAPPFGKGVNVPRSIFSKPRREAYKISQKFPGLLCIERRSHTIPNSVLFSILELTKNHPVTCSTDVLADEIENAWSRLTYRNPIVRQTILQAVRERDYKTLEKFFMPTIKYVSQNLPHMFR